VHVDGTAAPGRVGLPVSSRPPSACPRNLALDFSAWSYSESATSQNAAESVCTVTVKQNGIQIYFILAICKRNLHGVDFMQQTASN